MSGVTISVSPRAPTLTIRMREGPSEAIVPVIIAGVYHRAACRTAILIGFACVINRLIVIWTMRHTSWFHSGNIRAHDQPIFEWTSIH